MNETACAMTLDNPLSFFALSPSFREGGALMNETACAMALHSQVALEHPQGPK